jgi:spore germination protein (amino acid permease)
VSWLEAAGILTVFTIDKVFLVYPQGVAKQGMTAGWVIPVAAGLMSAAWLGLLVVVLRNHPGKNIVEIARSLAGPYVAAAAGIVTYLFILGVSATLGRETVSALITVILPLTPADFMLAVGILLAVYIAHHGMEVVGRLSVFVGVMTIAGVVVLVLLSTRLWDPDLMFPLLGPGIVPLAKASAVRQSAYAELLGIGFVAAYLRDPKKDIARAATWSLGATIFALSITVLTVTMVFPFAALVRIPAPFLRVTRFIYFGRFIQRLDSLFVVVWLTAGITSVVIGIWMSALAVASSFSLGSYKPLIVPTGIVGFLVGHFLPDLATVMTIDLDVIRPCSLFLLAAWSVGLFLLDRRRAGGPRVRRRSA